jgi:predicted enzyme related to lactoylglutathione lyase
VEHPLAAVLALRAAAVVAGMRGFTAIAGWVRDVPVGRVGSQSGGEPIAVLYTDDFDATLKSWRSAGVHVSVDPYLADGARVCHVQDLYGNEFVLVQLP